MIFADFLARNASYFAGNKIDSDLPYKINNKERLLKEKQEPFLSGEAVNTDL